MNQDNQTPAAPATEPADWWNEPTYTSDLFPTFMGMVTVTASSGEPTAAENGPQARFQLNLNDPLAQVDGGASAALTSLPGGLPSDLSVVVPVAWSM
jgi:hypothetical protein